MPTPEQTERAERARRDAMDASLGMPRFSDQEWEEHKEKRQSRYGADVVEMRAALLAAAPTPEEHARGIEAAREAVRNVAALNRALFGNENGCAETMADKAISAYLATVGGSDA